MDKENKEGVLADFGHREKRQKAWSLRAIFDMQISTLEKTEITEGNPGWHKVFAGGTNPGWQLPQEEKPQYPVQDRGVNQ
ncbi:MAG: hypothetical protein ACFUZC_04350 [Chthoniobacteraceae bacterium]